MTPLWPTFLGTLRGTVLELGPGAGDNLRHYAPGIRWLGVEPSNPARAKTRAMATQLGMRALVLPGRAEALELADASVDAVVCSFVLCSVTDQDAALAEAHRVLRPGGRFVFAEHVAAPAGTWTRRRQDASAAVRGLAGIACRPNRETGPAITRAGFTILDRHSFDRIRTPHIAGAAERVDVTKGITL
jgi:ubiquinone/menaquinone biosynthesis C-methylase UbiE